MISEHLSLPLQKGQMFERNVLLREQEIRDFALMSGDHNLLHLDPETALRSGFSSLIACGGQTSALLSAMVATELTRIKPSLGLQIVYQFLQPVFANRSYIAIWSLSDIRSCRRQSGSVVTFVVTMMDQKQDEVIKGEVRSIVYGLNDTDPAGIRESSFDNGAAALL